MNAKPVDLVNQAVKSPQTYAEILPHIKSLIKIADLKICKVVIAQVKKIIKDRKASPAQKLQALDLFQECMMLKNIHFLNFAQTKILDRLSILAQKKPNDLFGDSKKTPENLQFSTTFIEHLLTYIQIWASQFGRGAGGEPTLYANMYTQLSLKVQFPVIRSMRPAEKKKEPQIIMNERPRVVAKQSGGDKETLDYLENLLVIIEEIENPYTDETGKDLISNMMQLKSSLDALLNESLANGDEARTEKYLVLNDRIQKIVDKKPLSSGRSSEAHFKTHQVRMSVPVSKIEEKKEEKRPTTPKKQEVNIFDDILSLDVPPINSPPMKGEFNTYAPGISNPLFSSPAPLNPFEAQMFSSGVISTPIIPQPTILAPAADPKDAQRIAMLEKSLKEKEEIIENLTDKMAALDLSITSLNSMIFELKSKNDSLEVALKKTKEILDYKEKECEECHVLKEQMQKADIFEEIMMSPRLKNDTIKIPSESPADNEALFKFTSFEPYGVLYDNERCQVAFQINVMQNFLVVLFYIGNKSSEIMENIDIAIESMSSFELTLNKQPCTEIPQNSQINFEISGKMRGFSSVYPRISISFIQSSQKFRYVLKIPVSICRFSQVTSQSNEGIWQEWEDMMFNGESWTGKCMNMKKYIPRVLKLSDSVTVLTSNEEPNLKKDSFLVAAEFEEAVIAMVNLNRTEGICEIEVRANNQALRSSFLLLLASHITD